MPEQSASEYVSNLPAWDGVPRVEAFCQREKLWLYDLFEMSCFSPAQIPLVRPESAGVPVPLIPGTSLLPGAVFPLLWVIARRELVSSRMPAPKNSKSVGVGLWSGQSLWLQVQLWWQKGLCAVCLLFERVR